VCTVTTVNSGATSGDGGPLAAASFLVRRDAHADCSVVNQVPPRAADGEIVVEVSSFGFSSNNITYALTGDALGYWGFFPAEGGWGSIPVWGFGRVVESGHAVISPGTRVYGLLPPATHTVLRPSRCSPSGFMESSPHRTSLPAAYNWYELAGSDPTYDTDTEAEQMLLRPLFFTSFLLADLIEESEYAAGRVIISSASSKTANGTAYLIAARGGNAVGLTSPGRAGFVRSLGVYDEVLTYDELDRLVGGPATFLDFAGDPQIRASVHEQLGMQLTQSLSIGMTHVGQRETAGTARLSGGRTTFFFAPDRIKERTRDWGRDGLVQRFAAAWADYLQWVHTWLHVTRMTGLDRLRAVYLNVLSGDVDPAHGHIIELRGPQSSNL
jgi:Protein of unknown function (DUF2855)